MNPVDTLVKQGLIHTPKRALTSLHIDMMDGRIGEIRNEL